MGAEPLLNTESGVKKGKGYMADKIIKFNCTANSSKKQSSEVVVLKQSISISINSRETEAKKETYRKILSIYRKEF